MYTSLIRIFSRKGAKPQRSETIYFVPRGSVVMGYSASAGKVKGLYWGLMLIYK